MLLAKKEEKRMCVCVWNEFGKNWFAAAFNDVDYDYDPDQLYPVVMAEIVLAAG